uniref:Uncharacterized protein n=1 Tax=Schizaphis graminum TaxID=13262 RepID=A0A2S2NTR2_SCHGA
MAKTVRDELLQLLRIKMSEVSIRRLRCRFRIHCGRCRCTISAVNGYRQHYRQDDGYTVSGPVCSGCPQTACTSFTSSNPDEKVLSAVIYSRVFTVVANYTHPFAAVPVH